MKANWSCTTCGMYSSRRYSVQRHINKIHMGNGRAIPFIEYLVGRRSGKYLPGPKPAFAPRERLVFDIMKEEFERTYAKREVEKAIPPIGDPRYQKDAEIFRLKFMDFLQKSWRDSDK